MKVIENYEIDYICYHFSSAQHDVATCKNVHIFIFCQLSSREDVLEVTQARFWEFVPGQVVGSLSLTVVLSILVLWNCQHSYACASFYVTWYFHCVYLIFPLLTLVKSLLWQTKKGTDNRQTLEVVHDMCHELGIQDLTVQTEDAWVAAAPFFSSFLLLLNGDDIFSLYTLSQFLEHPQ